MIAVAVLASSPMMRARLESLVAAQPGLRLVSPPVAVAEARTAATGAEADVLLLDPGARRAEDVLRALAPVPRLPPIVLVGGDRVAPGFARMLRSGVRAVLPSDASAHEIRAAIEAAAAGLVVLHPSAALPATRSGARRAQGDVDVEPLTPRELEVLTMMAEGMGNRAIARHLGISTHTVKFHIAAILHKLDARSRTEAVATGMRRGLLMV